MVLRLAVKYVDFSIVCGNRSEAQQNGAFDSGNSRVRWPNSKHNNMPSLAVDIAPYPKLFSESDPTAVAAEFSFVAGFIRGVAAIQGVELRWGGDWNGNLDTTDQTLQDWGHLELVLPTD